MATEIPCVFHDSHHLVIDQDNDKVRVKILLGDSGRLILTHRAEFLAAIATELDVIVIDRDDLPEVVPHPRLPKTFTVGGGEHTTHSAHDAEYARERGIGYLAIAEHFDKHPPLDEAAVDALVEVCMTEGVADPHRTARRLVAAGVRAPQAGDDQ